MQGTKSWVSIETDLVGLMRPSSISTCLYTNKGRDQGQKIPKTRHGSELSSSSKTRVFVSGFESSMKFEVRTKVHEPEIVKFYTNKRSFLGGNTVFKCSEKKSKNSFLGEKNVFFQDLNLVKVAKKDTKLEKTRKFGSVTFSSVRFEVRV